MEATWPNLDNFTARNWHKLKVCAAGKVLCVYIYVHLNLLDIDHPLTFEMSKLRQIEAHDLIYLSNFLRLEWMYAKFKIKVLNNSIINLGI